MWPWLPTPPCFSAAVCVCACEGLSAGAESLAAGGPVGCAGLGGGPGRCQVALRSTVLGAPRWATASFWIRDPL